MIPRYRNTPNITAIGTAFNTGSQNNEIPKIDTRYKFIIQPGTAFYTGSQNNEIPKIDTRYKFIIQPGTAFYTGFYWNACTKPGMWGSQGVYILPLFLRLFN